jgi:photosystem II stability/assembly factor-like uncharacterized protein
MKSRFLFGLLLTSVLLTGSHNAFAQWNNIPDLQFRNIHCFLSAKDSTIFVGGDNATFLRSTNGGTTWTNIMGNGMYVDTVLSLGEGLGYLFAGSFGIESFYRSSDMGSSWSVVNEGLPSFAQLNAFTFVNTALFAATDHGVYRSVDSGNSWKADTAGLGLDPLFLSPGGTVGIASSGSKLFTIKSFGGTVYSSPIDTVSWTQVTSQYYNSGYAMAAVDTAIVIATLKGIYVFDGDSTWLPRNNGLPISDTTWLASCIFATSDSLLFAYLSSTSATVYSKQIYATSDVGKTWIQVNDSVFSGASVTAMATTGKYLFAGTQRGGWRIPIADVITSVRDDRPHVPSQYILYQNYPNPFNPTTVIAYSLPAPAAVTLKVYDLLGREIKTLVNERQNAGQHSMTFDGSNYPSGVYFYRLQAGTYSQTKKLIELK